MSQQLKHLLIVVAVLLSAAGCNNGGSPKPKGKGTESPSENTVKLTKADYQKAILLRNRGIAYLENKEWDEAEQALAELARLLPDSLLAKRNLAISRVLVLTDRESPFTRSGPPENAQQYDKAVWAAKDALQGYRGACVR